MQRSPLDNSVKKEAVLGCLIGGAVGDALGLPYEGLSPRRAVRLLGPPDRHRFLIRRGMVSDDTEHACMTLQSLLATDDATGFQRDLATRLKWWLASLPAGTGLATARAIMKLWAGVPPSRSGVFSAGNGPAMRAAILGVMLPVDRLGEYVAASTRLTHSDPKATWGAAAIALAAHLASHGVQGDGRAFQDLLARLLAADPADELLDLVASVVAAAERGETTADYCRSIGLQQGITGYVYHTVPAAIHAWLRHQGNYQEAIQDVIRCGGDSDTTASIVGGIIGAAVGPSGIPEAWQQQICDWPLTRGWMARLADVASSDRVPHQHPIPDLMFPARVFRNLFFLAVFLLHGLRRLAPPY